MRTPERSRLQTVSAFRQSRPSILAFWLGLAGGSGALIGCHRSATGQADQAAPSADAVKQSFAGLRKQFDDLQQSVADLGKDVEAIPAATPGFPQLRVKFYELEEARGVTNAKVTMLSDRLDAALRSGKRQELTQVSSDISKASADADKIGQLYIKLLHQVMAYRREVERHQRALAVYGAAPAPAESQHPSSTP